MDKKTVWIFLHPPRTGGGTLLNTLLVRVPKEEILSTSVIRYQKDPEKFDPKKIRFIIGHATYYGIHNLVPDKTPKYFIFLRDPAERLVSHYNVKMMKEQNPIPFDKWYKNQIRNEMVHVLDLKYKGSASTRIHTPNIFVPLLRKLSYKTTYMIQSVVFNILRLNKRDDYGKLENAKKLLDACWFVGIIENSDKDIPYLLKEMGLKEAKWEKESLSKKILILDDKLRKKIYEENPLDWELYNYALKLRGMTIDSLSERKNKKKI